MFALYLLFLPPLLSGRPRDRCWCPSVRLRRRRPFFPFSGASREAPPLIIPISPIPFSHACIRFCYCYCLLLFWCIACFCNLLIVTLPTYPKLLSIGWLVIHQWPPPCPCCPCFIIEDPINGYLVWLTCLREPPRQRCQKFFLLPLEHCDGFPRRGEDDAVK